MEMSRALPKFCHGSVGEIPRVCFIYAKRAVNEKIADLVGGGVGGDSSGFINEQSLKGGAFSRDLLDQKSKSLLFPGAGGAVVTND